MSPSGYVASLYSASRSLLGSVTMAHESGPVPGWQVATFATPISIKPNTTYVAAYYVPSGEYPDVYYGLTQGVTTGPLNVPASSIVGGNVTTSIGRRSEQHVGSQQLFRRCLVHADGGDALSDAEL